MSLSPPPTTLHARLSQSSRFYHPHNIGWGVQIIKLFIMKFSPLPATSALLGPNTLLNNLFSVILSQRSSL
jgi:hypothetical protein